MLTAVAPVFSRMNHSSFIRFLSGAAWASRNMSAMSFDQTPSTSDLEDLAFFFGEELVDLGDGLVRGLLHAL